MFRRDAKYPPGPASGLIGRRHLKSLKADLLGHTVALQREFGDVVSYRIGPVRLYQFTHPAQVSEILVKNADAFLKPRSVKFYFQRWMGSGLLLNEGEPWRLQRRKVRWAMQQLDPAQHAQSVVTQTRELLAAHCDREFDLAAAMDRLAFYLNVRTLLGADAAPVLAPLYDAANVMHSTGIREMLAWSLTPDWLPTESKRQLRQAMRLFDDVLLSLAAQRRAAAQPVGDLLATMIAAQDAKTGRHGMTDRQARDEAVNLLMGGKETVSASLMFAAYLLALHPAVQEQAADEVHRVLAGRIPTADDVERLPLVQMIVKEAMRLYPPVYMITRDVGRTVEIAGYRLRRGSQVHVPVWAMHRDARWFDRPDEFDPSRFRPELESSRRRYTYLPFGAGPRACVGKQIGYDQCVLVMACLLADYRLHLAPGQGAPRLATDIVLHPAEPLRMILESRQQSVVRSSSPGMHISTQGLRRMEAGDVERSIRQAAEAIAAADALVIAAGAGMGVDSGLPDFRGNEGFWRAYPPFRALNLSFYDLANPAGFARDPARAWGFYGHRLHLYRDASPHPGFALLRTWGESKPGGYFVFTSNVDGHFQRAGCDEPRILECHGSIHHLQCSQPCCDTIWPADDLQIQIDPSDFRACEPLPRCPHCGRMARPNILMFGDGRWLDGRTGVQADHYEQWLATNRGRRLAIIECGAGKAVPTVRQHCEGLRGQLIRINPRDAEVPLVGISIPLGAREALERIAELLE